MFKTEVGMINQQQQQIWQCLNVISAEYMCSIPYNMGDITIFHKHIALLYGGVELNGTMCMCG